MELNKNLTQLNTLGDRQKLRVGVGIKLESMREYTIQNEIIKIFGNTDNIYFCYLPHHTEKISKKFIKENLLKIEDIQHAKYLVLMIQSNEDPQILGIDLINKTNPKITTLHIDNTGTFNIDEDKTIYKNRTLIEQFLELQKDLKGGERELKVRFLKKFFEKQKLTEDFYAIYKRELFDKIKKNLITHFGKDDENSINNFILTNLNRLLFIHFLDKKGGVFTSYEDERGSYISYLFHKVYKELDTEQPFYEVVLKPLFFEALNKPYTERHFNHPILSEEFKDLPYLNGGLFKPTKYENEKHFIDNIFIKSFIINIIDQFNFTITEDTPLDIKVSVDPELLGYIFENLIQDYDNSKGKNDERSKGGIFYTPKIEVDFMCRQVLIEYLSKKEELKHLKLSLYELFYPEKGGRDDQKFGSFTAREIGVIFHYLEKIKVVDPACGSGAFLVGMMQVILDIENTLIDSNIEIIKRSDNEKLKLYLREKLNIFQRKKQLIKNTLHGVDIKPWAVEIAKLRLWLSMIVDINGQVFQNQSVKTQPLLPSFGFKIVQGDSLLNRIGTNIIPIDITRKDILDKKTRDKIDELTKLKNEYYDNKYKDENIVKEKEKEIYASIIESKITKTKKEIKILEAQKNSKANSTLFGESGEQNLSPTISTDSKKIDKQLDAYKSTLETLQKQLSDISIRGNIPFARGIDFSDIFTQNGGFDIVVGNPPYVRQEHIEDPVGIIKDKKIYKNLIGQAINQDWFDDTYKHKKDKLKIGGRSDLYLYFYFRGLKLLNTHGVFTFITSNSWLDVDFGSVLQEFLIKYCPSIKVFDNQIQRSFASASVNTIMCFLDKPVIEGKEIMLGKAQFVNFSQTYEESIWTETMAELDHQVLQKSFEEKTIKTGEVVFDKRTADELRVIDIDAENLWLDGSEHGEGGLTSLENRKYVGNKRGGKFLKAPEIFFIVLDKGGENIIKFGNILSFTQRNTLQGFSSIPKIVITNQFLNSEDTIPYLSSSKLVNKIKIDKLDNFIKVKESSKKGKKIKLQSPDIISNRFIGERLFFIEGGDFFVGDTFFVGFLKKGFNKKEIILNINSSLSLFFVESIGRKNMGDGVLLFYGPEFNQLPFFNIKINQKDSIINREIKPIFEELGFDKTKNIRSQTPNPLPDRKELDDIIFDKLGLTPEERNEVYRSLAELVKARLDKAKSV